MTRFLPMILLVSSCASITPEPFKGPDGGQAYVMHCSGMGRSLHACYQKAAEVCPNGYQVIEQRSGHAATFTPLGPIAGPQYSLAVECKP